MRLRRWLRARVWRTDLRRTPFVPRAIYSILRVIAHALRNLRRHDISIRAAGLTLVTLLALVPLLAIVFGIANGLGYGEVLTRILDENTRELPANLQDVVQNVRDLVDRTSFQALGWVSSLVVAWTALALFSRVEQAMNHAWNAAARRSWLRRATDFVALVVFVPLLTIGAFVFSSALKSAAWIESVRENLPLLGDLYDMGLGFVPYVLASVAFTALYKFMPSVDVRWRPALVAGIAAGSAMLFVFGLYLRFQVGVARMNAIYATLAALPLLLVYLQVAWTIVLLGAEVGYGVQNLHVIGPDRGTSELNHALRERLALKLVERASLRFANGDGPLPLGELAGELQIPREWLEAVARDLDRAGVIALTRAGGVLPARPTDRTTLDDVRRGVEGELPAELEQRLTLRESLDRALTAADAARAARLGTTRFDGQEADGVQ